MTPLKARPNLHPEAAPDSCITGVISSPRFLSRLGGPARAKCGGTERRAVAKILLIEDNEMNRDMLSRRLQNKGYNVIMAVDAKEGISKARVEAPDLILMDMGLPEMDGWEATRYLKSLEATQSIPVIALSARALASDREKALKAGCNDFETKPVEFQRLLAKIESVSVQEGTV